MEQIPTVDPKTFGPLLLDIAIMLLRAGASGRRIRSEVSRVAKAYQYSFHIDLGPKSISITLLNNVGQSVFNGTRSSNTYGVDFKTISGINRLSETVSNRRWTLEEIRNELHRLQRLSNYPRVLILLSVSIAGAAFCYTFGGRLLEMSVTFGATFFGLLVKQELQKRSINPYLVTYISALVAAIFTGVFFVAGSGIRLENAFATCVLFLIPGVPLINSVVDLVDGNILYGIERGVNAMMHAFAIAFGLSTALFIYISL